MTWCIVSNTFGISEETIFKYKIAGNFFAVINNCVHNKTRVEKSNKAAIIPNPENIMAFLVIS